MPWLPLSCNVVLTVLGLVGCSALHAAGAAPPSAPAASAALASTAAAPPALYGAIDLGARGVKAWLYSFVAEGEALDARSVFHEDIDTTLVSGAQEHHFTEAGLSEAAQAVSRELADLKTTAAKLKRTDVTYYVVGSSGLAPFDNRDDLRHAVEKETGLSIDFIDPAREAALGLLSAVPRNRREVAAVVDVGSGNTKVGCLEDGGVQSGEIPYGSVSLRKAAVAQSAGDAEYAGVIEKLLQDARARVPGCAVSRARLYWIGGAAWATATYMHPEEALQGFVALTSADIDGFLARLADGRWNQGEPAFRFAAAVGAPLRAQIKDAARADRMKVNDVFSREDLIAGVSLMRAVVRARSEPATMYFVRNGNYVFGWALEKFMADAGVSASAAGAAAAAPSSKVSYFGGIDLGSRGIKAFVYSFAREGEGLDARALFQKTISTKLTSSAKDNKFTPEGIAEAKDAVARLVGEMREFAQTKKIAPRFYIVASSGVAAYDNRDELKTVVDAASGLALEFIDAHTEALDAARSAVPAMHLQDSVVVDVGSGNTKLGCFTGETFNSDEIAYGTTKLRKAVPGDRDYEAGLQELLKSVTAAYRTVRMNTPCFGNRNRFYFVGGAPWATTTFSRPEMVRVGYVPFTRKDVEGFLARLHDQSWNQQEPPFDFAPKASADYRAAIRAENAAARADVQNVFAREDLMAGASLVKMILDNGNPSATDFFVRNGNYLFGYALAKYKDLQPEEAPADRK
jgi:exopolyphosphatase/pppGpp-phosphohydrolase